MDRLRQLKALYRDIQMNKNRAGDVQAAGEGDQANKQQKQQAGGMQQGTNVRAGQQTRPPLPQQIRNVGGGGGPPTRAQPPITQIQQIQARKVSTEAVQNRGTTNGINGEQTSKPKPGQQNKHWNAQQDVQEQSDELEQEAAAGHEAPTKTVLVDDTGALDAEGEERPNADESDLQYAGEGVTGNELYDFDSLQLARDEE